MNASIISVGQELLLGDTVNTNATWIGQLLSEHGIRCSEVVTIGDDADIITRSLNRLFADNELIIMTGGLGPTHDDITKATLLRYFNDTLVRHEPTFNHVKDIFERRGMPFSVSNHAQADVLSTADVLFNKAGTAPGMWFSRENRFLAVLPGVPREMKYLMQHEVMPRVKKINGDGAAYVSHYLQLTGIGESNLSDIVIGDTSVFTSEHLTLAYLPHTHGITLRVSSYAADKVKAEDQARELVHHLKTSASEYIYSESANEELQHALVRLLNDAGKTVSVAESCTGGQLSHLITNVPGSSAVFKGGVVAYDNLVKINQLGIPAELIDSHGAVSEQVALHMAASIAALTGSDFGLSTTGVAGPSGGTPEKPVGTVWVGFWSSERHFAFRAQLYPDRLVNKERSAILAMDTLRRHLSGITSLPYARKLLDATQ
ncbi:MAG: competence/damage-inducible protein A [Balneolales bacterium]|nr:competence/damage-inducible protein A [Balneolales bacterium]